MAGTILVRDIYAGSSSAFWGSAGPVVYNGELYFAASDASNGNELWRVTPASCP